MVSELDVVFLLLKMVTHIKVSFGMASKMDRVFLLILMGMYMMENGKMI